MITQVIKKEKGEGVSTRTKSDNRPPTANLSKEIRLIQAAPKQPPAEFTLDQIEECIAEHEKYLATNLNRCDSQELIETVLQRTAPIQDQEHHPTPTFANESDFFAWIIR